MAHFAEVNNLTIFFSSGVRFGFEAEIQSSVVYNVGTDAELLISIWEHYDFSTWNETLANTFGSDLMFTIGQPGLLFALAGNLAAANKYHGKHMESMAQERDSDKAGILPIMMHFWSVCDWATRRDDTNTGKTQLFT